MVLNNSTFFEKLKKYEYNKKHEVYENKKLKRRNVQKLCLETLNYI